VIVSSVYVKTGGLWFHQYAWPSISDIINMCCISHKLELITNKLENTKFVKKPTWK